VILKRVARYSSQTGLRVGMEPQTIITKISALRQCQVDYAFRVSLVGNGAMTYPVQADRL